MKNKIRYGEGDIQLDIYTGYDAVSAARSLRADAVTTIIYVYPTDTSTHPSLENSEYPVKE